MKRPERPGRLGAKGMDARLASPFSRRSGFDACCVGSCLLISFQLTLTLFLSGRELGTGTLAFGALPQFARMAALAALALASGKVVSLVARKRLLKAATAVMTACVLAALACVGPFAGAGWAEGAATCAVAVCNVAFAAPYLAWLELYARMDIPHVIAYFALARFLSGLLSALMLYDSAGVLTAAFLLASPAAALALLGRSLEAVARNPRLQPEEPSSGWSFPIRPAVLFFTVALANGMVRSPMEASMRRLAIWGVVACVGAYLAVIACRPRRVGVKLPYQLSMPVLVAGILCSVVVEGSSPVGPMLTNGAFALFSVFAVAVFASASYRYGVNPLWIMGLTEASLQLGQVAARAWVLLAPGTASGGPAYAATMACVVVALVALAMFLISDRDLESTWGVSRLRPAPSDSLLESRRQLEETCSAAAQAFGLTRREEEILLGIAASEEKLSAIAADLGIAESTMKTHTRHIYRKLGVSNREELLEFMQELGEGRG